MREIKFKAWDREEKKFINCTLGQSEQPTLQWIGNFLYADLEPWQQYTGLKDIDGKEIYEGDIVGHYVAEEIGGPRTFESFRSVIKWWPDMVDVDRARVIGNVYENPNLLEA